jgi:hypothetical protein
MLRGDSRRAAQLLAEAGYSAYYYENWDVLTESTWLGWVNHLATGSAGIYQPLEPIVTWAQMNRLQHIATKLRLAQAESLLWQGQMEPAAVVLEEASRRIGEVSRGLAGIHLLYLQASLQLVGGQFGPGGEALDRAIALQAGVSLRNFQTSRTSEMYDARAISPRIAVELYSSLLADPRPADWASQPLDAMAVLKTPQDAAFHRWFIAALERKDNLLALETAEMAKRRRFLAALPLGGRLLALRTILESPESGLTRDAVLERQLILTLFPEYRQLAEAAAKMEDALRAGPVLSTDAAEAKSLATQFEAWDENARRRHQLLMQFVARRLPASIEFPPRRPPAELQQSLAAGEALLLFHRAGEQLYGFLVTQDGVHQWELDDTKQLRTSIGALLREIGNYGANRALSVEELRSGRWQKPAAETFARIFAPARLDLSKTEALVIVPDDLLWYLPFDALVPDVAEPKTTLADLVPLRYGPTGALALSRSQPLRRPVHTGIVANGVQLGEDAADTNAMLAELEKAVDGALRIPSPLPEPARLVSALVDGLIVLDDVDGDQMTWSGWLPMPRGRGSSDDSAEARLALPTGGPERIVITGFATAAEQGLKPSRRGAARDTQPGSEVFQTLCGMMAGGARTILISRWRTGGRTNLDLVREFVQQLPQVPATEAWQRACLLARGSQLDTRHEPRLKGVKDTGELPTADHPFFWAGYLLIDTSPRLENGNSDDLSSNVDNAKNKNLAIKSARSDANATQNFAETNAGNSKDAGTGPDSDQAAIDQALPEDSRQ